MLNDKDQKKEDSEEEDRLVGPPAPEFLKNTLNLLGLDENEEEKAAEQKKEPVENLDKLINRTSTRTKKEYINKPIKHKIEPINKESYYRLIEEQKQRMDQYEEELEEYENEHRQTSLLELHQQKKAKEKKGHTMDEFMQRPFDKEQDFIKGNVDSKRAMKIMRENSGLDNRFVAKEKYVGF